MNATIIASSFLAALSMLGACVSVMRSNSANIAAADAISVGDIGGCARALVAANRLDASAFSFAIVAIVAVIFTVSEAVK